MTNVIPIAIQSARRNKFLILDFRFLPLIVTVRGANRKSKIANILCLASFVLFLTPSSYAEEPAVAMGIRTLGMGGASVAAVNDEDLFFSNPAALSQIENSAFSSFDLKTGFSQGSIPFISRLLRYSKGDKSLSKLTKTQVGNLNDLDPLYKSNGPLSVTYIRRYFGFGLFETLDLTFDSKYYGPYAIRTSGSGPSSVHVSAQPTTFGMISYARDVKLPPKPSWISIGGTFKYIMRAEVKRQDIDEISDQGVTAKIGRGFGFDVGLLYKIHDTYAVGLMIRDAISSQVVWGSQLVEGNLIKKKYPDKTKINPYATVGVSFTPNWEIPYKLQDFVLALDMDGMTNPEVGAEVTAYRFLKLRTGVSDDGIALGIGFKLGIFAFDYAFVSGFKDKYVSRVKDKEDISSLTHFVNMAFRL